jgi:predicted DNA-binding protein (UPF0251 family)
VSESETEPGHREPPTERDRDNAARKFYGSIISESLKKIEPMKIEMSAEEDQRGWERALLPWKVKRLEEEVNELRGRPKNRAKTKKLPQKKGDFSHLFDGAKLTAKQKEVASLAWEYGLKPPEIANRLNVDRKTIHDHLSAAKRRINQATSNERSAKKRAVTNPEKL